MKAAFGAMSDIGFVEHGALPHGDAVHMTLMGIDSTVHSVVAT
jgi:hypothetical protein